MEIIDGKKIAQGILERVKVEVKKLSFQPVFCDVLVGQDPASVEYVKMKAKSAEQLGFKFRNANFPENITTEELIAEIKKINQEPLMCGLIVQLPLPLHINTIKVLNTIDPRIDVDCTGEINSELFYQGNPYLEFPTAQAVMEILENINLDLKSKNFLVIGQGQLVGKPVAFLLKQKEFQLVVATNKTENILELLKNADVIISAAGSPGLILGNKIKPGCAIIDAGTSELFGSIVGDADFKSVKEVAAVISPVPGGVGPVTVAKLLENVLKVAKISGLKSPA